MVWESRARLDAGKLPVELEQALLADTRAQQTFHELPPLRQREFARWVAEGRRGEIRERRAAHTVMRLLDSPSEPGRSA